MMFMEIPFWILFGLRVTLGKVHWLAGVVSGSVLVAAFFLWRPSASRYKCDACAKQFPYRETIR